MTKGKIQSHESIKLDSDHLSILNRIGSEGVTLDEIETDLPRKKVLEILVFLCTRGFLRSCDEEIDRIWRIRYFLTQKGKGFLKEYCGRSDLNWITASRISNPG